MSELGLVDSDIEDVDGRGLCAIPGLVDCHTHPAFGGDRVDEFSLRAGGAGYEELHAAGGGILSTVRATREAGEDGLRQAVERHRGWMLRAGTTTFEGKSGYGLDRETELASLRAIRDGRRRPDVPRRALDAAGVRRRRRVSRLPPRRRAAGRGAGLPRPRTSSSSAARSTPARLAAIWRRAASTASRSDCTATSSPKRARSRSRSSSTPAPSTTSKRPGRTASPRSPRATSPACCSPRARSSSPVRCRPPARSSTRAPPSRSRPTSIPAAPSARACRS